MYFYMETCSSLEKTGEIGVQLGIRLHRCSYEDETSSKKEHLGAPPSEHGANWQLALATPVLGKDTASYQ